MQLPINQAVQHVPPSGIRRIFNMASELSARGKKIYPFHLGAPDFDTPDAIKAAAIHRLQAGFVHYAPNAGIPELRRAIAESVNGKRGTNYTANSVIVSIGACEAISIALMATCEPGSEIIVPTPCWMNYLMLPRILGINAVEVPMDTRTFLPHVEAVRAKITERTRAILLNTPSNPTGAIIPPEVLRELVALASERSIWLICDEVYEDIVYSGFQHYSPLCIPGADQVTMLISGFSKTFSMTGWRLGYVLAPPTAIDAMLKVHQYLVTSATSFTQWGALTALNDRPQVAEMQAEYQKRRDVVVPALQTAGIDFVEPGGSFFVFPRIPERYIDDEAFCQNMLTEHGLALVPGSVFGADYARHFRLCFACATEDVIEGIQVLVDAVRT
jgi:aspartate/methionine/tyrosine aminotransferase